MAPSRCQGLNVQDGIGRGLDTGNHVGGREGCLIDLCKVVFRVLFQREVAEGSQGHLTLRPDLDRIEDVPAELLRLPWGEDSHVTSPGGVLAASDGVE